MKRWRTQLEQGPVLAQMAIAEAEKREMVAARIWEVFMVAVVVVSLEA